jgi:hypothetical protein
MDWTVSGFAPFETVGIREVSPIEVGSETAQLKPISHVDQADQTGSYTFTAVIKPAYAISSTRRVLSLD